MKRSTLISAVLAITTLTQYALAQSVVFGGDNPHSKRKYDFAIVNKERSGISSWGSWNQGELERFKARGTGLYVKKNATTYVITDSETLKKVDDALGDFRAASGKLRESGHAMRDSMRTKDMEKRAKVREEYTAKIHAEAQAYAKQMREGRNPEATERFRKKMQEFREKMHEDGAVMRMGLRNGEFGKQMQEFGRKMGEAASAAGLKIERLIDQAFSRNLAKRF